jgi:hypothetical protein
MKVVVVVSLAFAGRKMEVKEVKRQDVSSYVDASTGISNLFKLALHFKLVLHLYVIFLHLR